MSKKKNEFVKKKIESMSLAEKVGQCLTFTWRSNVITPSTFEMITRLHAGGLCLEPYTLETCKNLYWGRSQIDPNFKKPADYFAISNTYFNPSVPGISVTPEEYTEDLNKLQKIAMNRPSGIPLHITIDFEGDFKNDYTSGGIRQFPPPMGLAAIGDIDLTYQVGLTIGRQLSAIGVTQMYSPVCDVNINPRNPEIGVRSFSDDPKVCAKFAVALAKGFQDGGLAATAKHFPGRGDSAADAHDVLDVVHADKKRMHDVELYPFKAVIDAGIKGIMTAHTIYPVYDKEFPSTLSPHILTELLRNELGFDGVIVSDAIGMAAILRKWPTPKACVLALKAGVDTILLKADDESRSQCFFGIKHAVETGELSEDRLDDAVRHILNMKYDQGLFEKAGKMDPEKTHAIVRSKEVTDLSTNVAKKALMILRDDKKLIPLKKEQKILVIEQRIPYAFLGKDSYSHTHMFCEAMTNHSYNLILTDTEFHANDGEIAECLKLAKQADLVVMTNYYARIVKRGNNQHLVQKLKEAGHTVVVVTNYPYIEGTTKEADAVVCNFSGSPDSIRVSADLLFGKIKPSPSTRLPVSNAP
jgi:beta-N-acetylhexosaminidase